LSKTPILKKNFDSLRAIQFHCFFSCPTSLSPAGNASEKTDTMKKYFDFHKPSKKTGVAGQVQKIVIRRPHDRPASTVTAALRVFTKLKTFRLISKFFEKDSR
jgi:hypothetical protein